MDDHVVDQPARRCADKVDQTDIAWAVRSIHKGAGHRCGKCKQADRAVPGEDQNDGKQNCDDDRTALPPHPFPVIVFHHQRIAQDVDRQTETPAERIQQEELEAKMRRADQLEQKQPSVRFDLI